jgi:hypothetical protein
MEGEGRVADRREGKGGRVIGAPLFKLKLRCC